MWWCRMGRGCRWWRMRVRRVIGGHSSKRTSTSVTSSSGGVTAGSDTYTSRTSAAASRRSPHQASTALVVSEPKLRATVAGSDGNAVALDFELVGPSERTEPLRSGELRQQLGLELVAQDTCNLLYVMWRVAPRSELVVSAKQNPGQSTHARCENRGYRRLRAEQLAPVPALVGGARHTLAARIDAGRLEVTIDGERVLSAALDGAARELHGRVGLRSDNLRFVVHQLRAAFAEGGPTCDG